MKKETCLKSCLKSCLKTIACKKKGDSTLITSMIAICFLAVMLMFQAYYVQDVDVALNLQLLGRRYISAMETTGYLTSGFKTSLKTDLEAIGADNIDFTGTSMSPVAYGQDVFLHVTGKIKVNGITGYEGFQFVREKEREFTLTRKITAKY